MTLDQFLNEAFAIRNQTHLWHLQTRLDPEHRALGAFYDSWLDLTDSFVETCSGRYGKPSGGLSCQAIPYSEGISLTYIKNVSNWLLSSEVRSFTPESHLQNILDEMTALADHTVDMLTLL